MRTFLVLAWTVLVVAGYGLTVLLDEPREVGVPADRVAPQGPRPSAVPPPAAPGGGCPEPQADAGAESSTLTTTFCAVMVAD